MIGILLLTHGGLARELLSAAEMIAGPYPNVAAVPLDWSASPDRGRERVERALGGLDRRCGVLILTDLAGGTPSNIAMKFQKAGEVEVLSGVNLPMVVRLFCVHRNGSSLDEVSEWIREKGRRSICTPRPERAPDPCEPREVPVASGGRRS